MRVYACVTRFDLVWWSILCGFEALWSIDVLVQFVRDSRVVPFTRDDTETSRKNLSVYP